MINLRRFDVQDNYSEVNYVFSRTTESEKKFGEFELDKTYFGAK